MTFYKISFIEPAIKIIAGKLTRHLSAGERVLWLITGGTAIKVEAGVSRLLSTSKDLDKLTIILMDERFGAVGHADSNWHQLMDSGFNLSGSTLIPILSGKDIAATTLEFTQNLENQFAATDYSIGLFGIGPDGHTAGILPESPNITTSQLAVSYADSEATQNFTPGVYRDKDRVTITAAAIAKLDEALVVALGKEPELFEKLEKDIPIEQMPAQALKQVANLSIYNDHKGVSPLS